ncbi:MAG: substrate-binding domain-containing protein [Chloroflexi bacterium]|nr:substrate-binding domain-containing protein [Chloroflexota bacterium]
MLNRFRGRLAVIAAIAIAVVVTTAVNQLWFQSAEADSHGSSEIEVRINVQKHADGSVEFGLQQRVDEAWSTRLLPKLRFLRPHHAENRWFSSSAIALDVKTAAAQPQPQPMMCIVANGDSDKLFWQFVAFHSQRAADLIGVDLTYASHTDPADRVHAIEECVEHGAKMIVSTLADADTVIPALESAAKQGVKIASFGAGEEHADRAGSLIHVSLNESAAGRRAAEQFNELGISGTVFCVVPHDTYEDRKDICEAVEDDYTGGHVEQFQLTAGHTDDQIESLLTDHPDAAGLLVLEADLLPAAIEAMDETGVTPALGSIGEYPLSRLSFAQRDQIDFTVMALERFETLLSAAALHLMYSNHPNARFFEGAMIFDGVPNVHTGGPKGGHGRDRSGQQTDEQGHDDDHGYDDDDHGDDDSDDGHDDDDDDHGDDDDH